MVLNYRAMIKLTGIILIILALSMLPSLLVSLIYREGHAALAFIFTIVPMTAAGTLLTIKTKINSYNLKIRDGYMIVALCWGVGSVLGSLPFIISGYIPNFADAFFETASGFTTTGASILEDVEALPKGLLFWRSFTHWIGGMGILVFAIALLPALGISGHKLAKAETTGPTVGKLTAKFTDSSKILYTMYLGLTIFEVILLLFGDMSLYDALIHTFGSVGTGGFSNYGLSIAQYGSLYIEVVIMVFMTLAGINFTLFYYVLKGHWSDFFRDGELRLYLTIIGLSIALITINLWGSDTYETIGESLRYSSFQVSSIITTTGFASANYDLWPSFSKMVLFLLFFVGGCSSSTSGGIKVVRILILMKLLKRGIATRLHPRAIVSIKIDGKAIANDTASNAANFVFLYIAIFFFATLLVSLENYDLITTASAVGACLGNIGPGFNLVGPVMNYSIFSDLTTFFLGVLMLAGRLELFTIILLFTRQYWNPDK